MREKCSVVEDLNLFRAFREVFWMLPLDFYIDRVRSYCCMIVWRVRGSVVRICAEVSVDDECVVKAMSLILLWNHLPRQKLNRLYDRSLLTITRDGNGDDYTYTYCYLFFFYMHALSEYICCPGEDKCTEIKII